MSLSFEITKEITELVTPQYAFEHNVIPIKIEDDHLIIGIEDTDNIKLLSEIAFDTGYKVKPIKISAEVILSKLREVYPDYDLSNHSNNDTEFKDFASEFSNVELVNQLIVSAIKAKSSDIHIEALKESYRIRYRVDGHLREVSNLPKQRGTQITSRIKIMSNLDISEKRRPQDGKISFNHQNHNIDIRVSSLPTNFGEKMVLRILDKSQVKLDLIKLGLSKEQHNLLLKKITSPYGMVLVTGPTGSGKTTSLYAALQQIHTPEKNILTVEDPIEYNLDGINQCNVKPDIGFNFANALRSFLRQDPDVIMVGEIRDKETAEIAIRASLTGHLVFSTLHTNDSVSGITRLIDMGIEPYLVAASVKLIIAQRLVRTLCSCKVKEDKKVSDVELKGVKFYKKAGCEKCKYTGYTGRLAIFEFLDINEQIEELISGNEKTSVIRNAALKNGFKTLRDDGIEKIKMGTTSYEEVLRETMV